MAGAEWDELLGDFLAEGRQELERVDQALLALEGEPGDGERLTAVFRHLHTLKGNCRIMEFHGLERMVHAAETLLSQAREAGGGVDAWLLTALLSLVDELRRAFAGLEGHQGERPLEYAPFTALLENLATWKGRGGGAGGSGERQGGTGSVRVAEADEGAIQLPALRLSRLMDQVGELVTGINHLSFLAQRGEDRDLVTAAERSQSLVLALQEEVLTFRLQPVRTLWGGLPRLVRDLAATLRKQVVLGTEGGETQVDRSILAALKEVYLHLVRNAVDHGIEPVEERLRAGKPGEGRLTLKAWYREGTVNLEVADDGRGMDPGAIRRRAVAQGLVTPERAAALSGREIHDLIFLPGFSTASAVGEISGRGMGMEVVRTVLERLRGTMDIHSEPGHGTRYRIRIPQTMVVEPFLIACQQGTPFGIPQRHIVEVVELPRDQLGEFLETRMGEPVVRLRGRLLPLLDLGGLMGDGGGWSPDRLAGGVLRLIRLRSSRLDFCLAVEETGHMTNLVVKPLGKAFAPLTFLSGAAILEDGGVAIILNVERMDGLL